MGPELSPQLFSIFSALIEERAGIHYTIRDRDLLRDKLAVRAAEAGFDSLLDYYYFLRYDPGGDVEFAALVDTLVVGETYFFREWGQVVALVDRELVPLAGERPIRIWSAACSTGEEPLSLAMLLNERGILDRTTIVASDISRQALARARTTVRSRRSVRAVPDPALAERWLEVGETEVRVDPALVSTIDWRRINLLDRPDVERLGTFDAILCRNVLIYFSDEVIGRVIASLLSVLRPGGVVAVGVSESLLRFGGQLVSEEKGGFFFYRRAT